MAKKCSKDRIMDVINCTEFKSKDQLIKIEELCDCYYEAYILSMDDFDMLMTMARKKYRQDMKLD